MWLLSKGQRFDQKDGYAETNLPELPPMSDDLTVNFTPSHAAPLPPLPAAPPEQPHLAVGAAQAIGGRYETMHTALDGIGRLVEQLRQIEPLMQEVRGPLLKEYETRRSEHAELTALRYAHEQVEQALGQAQHGEREAVNRLAVTEVALSEAESIRASQATMLEERDIELDRTRDELLQAQMRVQYLESSLRDTNARGQEMTQDIATLRGHLDDIDRRRSEAETLLARQQQDNALAIEEASVLKKRYEAAAAEVSRLTRVESDLDSQLTAERSRLLASESAALSAQQESTRIIRSLETQLELVRSEMSSIQTRVETATVRAAKLEELNGQQGARLAEAGNRQQAAERAASERQTLLDRATERVRVLEEEGDQLRQRVGAVETARAAAVERAEQLSKSLSGHERAVERAEGRAGQIRQKLERIMSGHEAALHERDGRIDQLQKEVERARAEAALAEGALETVRRDRDRLQVALFGNAAAA